jgi:hypothetical protein
MQLAFLLSERKMEKLNSPLQCDEDIWDELFHSEASKQFLDRLIEQAKEELQQQTK